MESLTLVFRFLLAGIFVLSGVTKLIDPLGTVRSLMGFGVPRRFAGMGGLLLPVVELIVAMMLLVAPLVWFGAVLAQLLLMVFIGAIAGNLLRGRSPDCHCFGSLHSEPISWRLILRNVLLAALAVPVMIGSTPRMAVDVPSRLPTGDAGVIPVVAAVVSIAAILLLAALWFRRLRIQERGETTGEGEVSAVVGLPPGEPAPGFVLPNLSGGAQSLEEIIGDGRGGGRNVLLLFITPTCSQCEELLADLPLWKESLPDDVTPVIISKGEAEATRQKLGDISVAVGLQLEREVVAAYRVRYVPSAVLVRANGTVGSWVVEGSEAIRAYLRDSYGIAAGTEATGPLVEAAL